MNNKSILITGASDGIGKALALVMAKRGYNLALTARRLEKLQEIEQHVAQAYPNVKVVCAAYDVCAEQDVLALFQSFRAELGQLDIALINAGISYHGKLGDSPLEAHQNVFKTNVNGALVGVDAALRVFREQGYGHLVGTSSVAAYRGLPGGAVYSASKAALSTLLEAVRIETRRENIDVSVLHPGYIDTRINQSMASRPFLIEVERGAEIFADLIERKVKRSTVPRWPWALVAPVLKVLPDAVIAKM